MKAADTSAPTEQKTKLFKSKKELVVLAVSAAVFAAVVLKTYVLKKPDRFAAAEPPAEASSVQTDSQNFARSSAPPPDVGSLLNSATGTAEDDAAPAELARDPFVMTNAFQDALREPAPAAKAEPTTSAIITLTPQNLASVMATIPGAEKAAAKGLLLEAVMLSGDWRGAVINGRVFRVGESVLGFELTEVESDAAVLRRDQHRVRILLRPTNAKQDNE